MTRLAHIALVALLGLSVPVLPAAAQDISDVIVYIECGPPGGQPTSRGSGVVVSEAGHVLTARHVVENQTNCRASKRVADGNLAGRVNIVPVNAAVDLGMVVLSTQGPHAFVPYCPIEPWMVRRKIFVAGFPGMTSTGAASYREGVLSTSRQNNQGVLETDGQTVEGMSGGPVFSRNLEGIVGIVIGASTVSSGSIEYYGILPVADYIQVFPGNSVTKSTKPCYHKQHEVDFRDPATGAWTASWTTGDPPKELGVGPDEGSCFLRRVFGQFNDPGDTVSVKVQDGVFVLDGTNVMGGTHGAEAACTWNDF
jgi:trypsin-like peptidase